MIRVAFSFDGLHKLGAARVMLKDDWVRASFWKRGDAAGRLAEAFPTCKDRAYV